ncbi:MAG: phosphoribosyltransferase [Promethearchaeota archaeon]
MTTFRNRTEAGQVLATELKKSVKAPLLICAIPNGGVPVAIPIIRELNAFFSLLVVRKLQIPYNPEAGFGALTSTGFVMLNEPLVARLRLKQKIINQAIAKARYLLDTKLQQFGSYCTSVLSENHTCIVVDDGLASGYTMRVAVEALKQNQPKKLIIAAPTASQSAITLLQPHVTQIICPDIRHGSIFAVADAYDDWYDLSDEEVHHLLKGLDLNYENDYGIEFLRFR